MTVKEAIKKVIDLANSEVGFRPTNGKHTKYAKELDALGDFYNTPKDGYDYCDVFFDWLFVKSFGADIGRRMIYQPKKSSGAGVPYSAGYYKANGAFKKVAEVGSQIFFGGYHTGIVVEIEGDYIYTVEGNTGAYNGVERKKYVKTNPAIAGFGVPNWTLALNIKNEDSKNDIPIKEKIEQVCANLAEKSYNTIQGKNGNGADRVKALGDYYTPVQWIINEVLKE